MWCRWGRWEVEWQSQECMAWYSAAGTLHVETPWMGDDQITITSSLVHTHTRTLKRIDYNYLLSPSPSHHRYFVWPIHLLCEFRLDPPVSVCKL
ncbi:hypothetical protein RJT34_28920 [Clitoria ternatea]|uniref:Uncharacterized protein n=1 Tax=Clitoria ternatea TaxID=43366 RepID=A0AAN9FBV6_CLITE